jgi:hypothetical protein
MKTPTKGSILLAVTLIACAAAMGRAQTATWNPDDTAVSGAAESPTFVYEGVEIFCEVGTFDGTTGNNSLILIAWLAFDNCTLEGVLQAEVDCEGTLSSWDVCGPASCWRRPATR